MEEKDKTLSIVKDEEKDNQEFTKLSLKKRVEALAPGKYNLFQELLQEIQASDIIDNLQGKDLYLENQLARLKILITNKFSSDKETADLLLEYTPPERTIYGWFIDEWKEAVMLKVKSSFRFNESRRSAVFDSIYKKAVEKGDMKAAELFCKLSGDLESGKGSKESKEMEDFKDFNRILHGKK